MPTARCCGRLFGDASQDRSSQCGHFQNIRRLNQDRHCIPDTGWKILCCGISGRRERPSQDEAIQRKDNGRNRRRTHTLRDTVYWREDRQSSAPKTESYSTEARTAKAIQKKEGINKSKQTADQGSA